MSKKQKLDQLGVRIAQQARQSKNLDDMIEVLEEGLRVAKRINAEYLLEDARLLLRQMQENKQETDASVTVPRRSWEALTFMLLG